MYVFQLLVTPINTDPTLHFTKVREMSLFGSRENNNARERLVDIPQLNMFKRNHFRYSMSLCRFRRRSQFGRNSIVSHLRRVVE